MKKIDPRRLEEVERRYLAAQSTHDIERDLAAEWAITRRQVRTYLAIVRKRLAEAFAEVSADDRRAQIEALLLRAYRTAEAGGASGPMPAAMVAAAKAYAEVVGVAGPQRVELTGRDGGPIAMSGVRVFLPPESDE